MNKVKLSSETKPILNKVCDTIPVDPAGGCCYWNSN